MLLMIDNYDSFTYNVVQYLGELGAEVKVVRNDEMTVAQIAALNPERIVVSPGPCTPTEAGISLEAIRFFAGKLPILGRLPGPPVHRPGIWRRRGACPPGDARQDQPGVP
jgi:anthranilate synthase component II